MSTSGKGAREIVLDKIDLDILRSLQENSRASIRDLSSKLGIPKSTIYYKIKKLEELGVIKGYSTILDSEKLGFEYLVVILIRGKYGPNYHEEIGKFLSSNLYVQAVYFILGDVDFVVIGKFPNKEKYIEFLEALINSRFIERSSTMVIAKVIKENFRLNI